MTKLWQTLRGWLGGRERPAGPESQFSDQELGDLFKSRYHDFRLLLAANNKALEIMAEMEKALRGQEPFGMRFVQARCTALGVTVYQMVKQLDALAPGKYAPLFERHQAIQEEIQEIIRSRGAGLPTDTPLVLPLAEVNQDLAWLVGGKMANLGEVKSRLGLKVPPGFVVTAAAYFRLLAHNQLQGEINRQIQATVLERTDQLFALSSRLQQLIIRAELPPELAEALAAAYEDLAAQAGERTTVSLRSSALGEDALGASFAGQYRSQLNVHPDYIPAAYKEVAASKYTPQAMHYRLMRGLKDEEVAMSVGCLAMVRAVAGGVAYTHNPLADGDRRVHIAAAWGLPKLVVDGDAANDLFVVERGAPLTVAERQVAVKAAKFQCYPDEGVCRLDLTGEEAADPALTDSQILELAGICLKLEAHYGYPLDIEWALDHDGEITVLQCRPLQRLEHEEPEHAAAAFAAPVLARGGVRVSPGAAAGPVYWVDKDQDALGFPRGAVLAVRQPLPRWASLLSQASALISLTGGAAGHLATVAREYDLPALFGLEGAAAALVGGQEVTVDADGGTVYQGRVAELLAAPRAKQNLHQGSPVQQTLEKALALISPLNLLDPASPLFAPQHCRTLHDITRFCHEKSVNEMFDFGHELPFPKHAAKQLHFHVPMQYWIINLEDGFKHEVKGKYVHLEDLDSPPMMAVWEGMTAVPWAGPPAVSGRGLAAVMFQATANPGLGTPFKSPYANRNYFMISHNFLNLQSRFGFHFAQVEALVGERQMENYVSFSFKGGAADQSRKEARARLIASVLEEIGFRVQITEDNALCRAEGLPGREMLRLLKVVGHMIMHTRQLDMVMGNPSAVAHYREKLSRQVAQLMAEPLDAEDAAGGDGATA
ncbi:MAG: pyruvate, water dikinase [Deltaproteobacteria bacterium]|nr:pyruvate, water dikinase [Deltaproteobacteria bacterium]